MKLITRNRVIALAAALLVVIVTVFSGAFKDKYKDLLFVEAQEGEFILDVVVRGELLAERSRSVDVPEVRGMTQLVWLIEDGVPVEQGQEVARLNMNDLENQLEQREQSLENEQANLDNFLASKPNRIRSAESSLQTAQYDLDLAKIRLDLSEFESRQSQEQRQLSYENALLRVDEAERNLESTKSKLEIDEMRQRTRIRQAQQRLDDVRRQLNSAVLKAPISGIAVLGEMYAGATEGERKVRAGDNVHRGQTVVTIPDLSEMLSKIRIDEGDYRKVSVGSQVEVRLDAIQGPVFQGHIEEIAALASYDDRRRESYFNAVVRLDSLDTGMRPGMTASIRIITDKLEAALYIPNEAVFDVEGRTVVFPRRSLPEPREVRLGDRNLDFVIVLEGLEPGEEISLSDPRELQRSAESGSPVPGATAPSGQKNRSGGTPPSTGRR